MWETTQDAQIGPLQAKVDALEARLETLTGVLGLMRPASAILDFCGADKAQQQALFALVDEMANRLNSGSSASYAEFEERVADLVPGKRGDRRFLRILIHAIRLELPDAKPVLDYLTQTMALFRA